MQDPLLAWLEAHRNRDQPWLEFLSRRWLYEPMLEEAARVAAGLRQRGLNPGERLGLLLPNLPVAVVALLSAWRAGLVAAPMDPRQPTDALLDWQERVRPAALVTLDLATVQERVRPLFDDRSLRLVAIARMATQLSPMKRLLSPWLRAGGTARPVFDARTLAWESLQHEAADLPPASAEAPALLLPDGTALSRADTASLAVPTGGRHLLAQPLAHPGALRALLGSLAGGGTLVLSPRLDERSLAKVAAAAGTAARVP